MQCCRGPSETELNIVFTNEYLHRKRSEQEFPLQFMINKLRVSNFEDYYESEWLRQ
jgi:hypothetical protein